MIYLDNAATSFPKPLQVAKAANDYIVKYGGNAGRASHKMANKISKMIFETRDELSKFFNVLDSSRLIFTYGATHSLNMVISSVVKNKPKALIVISSLEHNSVVRPLRELEKDNKINLIILNCNQNGKIADVDLQKTINKSPDLFIINAASNVTGTLLDYKKIIRKCTENGIKICIDASQIVGHVDIDINELQPDYFCFSMHKGLLSISGLGGLYVKENSDIYPLIYGGTGSLSSSEYQPLDFPDYLEAGTQNIVAIAALNGALDFFCKNGLNKIISYEKDVMKYLLNELKKIEEVKIYGKKIDIPVLSFDIRGIKIDEIAYFMDKKDIAVRMGLHCSPLAHKTIGSFVNGGTVRVSPGYFTKEKDIKIFLRVIKEIIYGK